MVTRQVLPEYPADTVRRLYDTDGSPVAAEFLARHPHLVPLLVDLRRQVDRHIGASASIRLEVVTDPEEGDRALFARIQTDLALHDALQRLDTLVDAWWLEALPRARGLFHLGVRRA